MSNEVTIPLAELVPGSTGVVSAIDGNDLISHRLMEMGICEGEPIEFLKSAPLGDPIEVRVIGFELSLRRSEARRIKVRTERTVR